MAIAWLATACTALVAAQLSDTDDYGKGDSSTPSGSSGQPDTADAADKCALLSSTDDSNQCATCISSHCADDVEIACNRDAEAKSWFSSIRGCARRPFVGSSYGCSQYDNPDADRITDNSDTAHERDSLLCIRDQCLQGQAPPCKLCDITVDKPGSAGGSAKLEESRCGSCLREQCDAVFVRCCNQNQSVMSTLAKCGYTAAPEYKRDCMSLATLPDGGKPSGSDTSSKVCDYDVRSCFQKCAATCESSP